MNRIKTGMKQPSGVRRTVLSFALGALVALATGYLAGFQRWPAAYVAFNAEDASEPSGVVPRMHALLSLDTVDAIPADTAARIESPENQGVEGPWTGFGKELCIINVDTRGHDSGVLAMTNVTQLQQGLEYRTAGAYGNLMYAIRHGYSYHLVVAPEWEGHENTWVKVPQLYAVLQHYRFVVLFDGDTFISDPRVPMHVLMNRWGFQEDSSLLLAEDPPSIDISYASNGKRLLNTGFILAQNTQKAFDILEEWGRCIENTEGCAQWAFEWAHEQTALTEYFRTDDRLVEGKDLIAVPCDEGNGSGLIGCNGVLVTHLWMRPGEERLDRVLGNIMHGFLSILEAAMSEGNTVLRRMPSNKMDELKGIQLLAGEP